jgi:hypothetical protein
MMKLTTMQRKYLLRVALVLLLIAGSYAVLWSSSRRNADNGTCTESMDECCKKSDQQAPSGEMIWESLSRQFFSAVEISR